MKFIFHQVYFSQTSCNLTKPTRLLSVSGLEHWLTSLMQVVNMHEAGKIPSFHQVCCVFASVYGNLFCFLKAGIIALERRT